MIGLAACHASSGAASPTTTSAVPSTTASTPSSTTPTTTTASTVSVGGPARCHTADLSVALPAGSGAAGTIYYELDFRNDSASTCEMTGYPGVSFLDASGTEVGLPAQRSKAAYSRLEIAPHGHAYAVLAVADPDVRACPTGIARVVRVFPPNETQPLLITIDSSNASGVANGIRVCAQQVPPATIDPVVATSKH